MKTISRRRKIKSEIFSVLENSTVDELENKLNVFPRIPLINSLFMALCDANECIKWHAVSSFGWLVPLMAEEDAESARVIMRRFLWTLNDESGGIGWGAPESMAQIMCRNDLLRAEYVHMLISYMRGDGEELLQDGNFLELPMLQRGLLWGVGMLCREFPQEMAARGVEPDLLTYLDSIDVEVKNLALWALSELGEKLSASALDTFRGSDEILRVYIEGDFFEIPLVSILTKLQQS